MGINSPGRPTHITTTTTTQAHTGNCILERVVVNSTASGTVAIYDDTDGTDNAVAILPSSAAVGTYEYGAYMAQGVRVVTGANYDLTVIVRPMG